MAAGTVDAPAVYRNLDSFATVISGRGMGSREPQLMAPEPRYANVAVRNGAPVENADRLTRHMGRYLADCASDDEVRKAAEAAAHLESSMQMAAYRINALDAKLTDTRRAMRAGSLLRGIFAIYSQPPHLFAPKVDRLVRRALGSAAIGQRAESESPAPAAEAEGGADD